MQIADSVADKNCLGDQEFAREIYKQVLEKAVISSHLRRIADSVADKNRLGDQEFAREIYQQAIERAVFSSDLIQIADSVADKDYLGGQEFAREIYKKAIERAENVDDLIGLAEDIVNRIGDKVWGREVYQLAITKSENSEDIIRIADSVADQAYLDDKEWSREILKMNDLDQTPASKLNDLFEELYEKIEEHGAYFHICAAAISIVKWLRNECELEDIALWRKWRAILFDYAQKNNLNEDLCIAANDIGIAITNMFFEVHGENANTYFRTYAKSLGVAGMGDMLSNDETGALGVYLIAFPIIAEMYDDPNADKYVEDIETICTYQLDANISECEEAMEFWRNNILENKTAFDEIE